MNTIQLSQDQYQDLVQRLEKIEQLLNKSLSNHAYPQAQPKTWEQEVHEAHQEYQASPQAGTLIHDSQELQTFLDDLKSE